jgi:signal transduction histidine kinase
VRPLRLSVLGLAVVAVTVAASMLLGARPFGVDIATAKAYGLGPDWRLRILLWWIAALPGLLGILVAYRWPVTAYVAAVVSAGSHLLLVSPGLLPVDLATIITLYAVAAHRSRRVSIPALACGTVLAFVLYTVASPHHWQSAVVPALAMCAAWALGDSARTRRLHLRTLEERAADLVRERDQRAALAVAAERARIARELHDVVAHAVTVMVIQAQAASAALPEVDSDESRGFLAHIVSGGRASLAEMRRLLGLIRAGSPQPSLGVAALPDLIEQARIAGTPVHLTVDGEPAPLPAAVDLSAYRIVQEALTNTRRHAGSGAQARVRLAYSATSLDIAVVDDGVGGAAAQTGGLGLLGIAERVAALGGTLAARPHHDGGFGVHARIPLVEP